jgi:hypothetical protein
VAEVDGNPLVTANRVDLGEFDELLDLGHLEVADPSHVALVELVEPPPLVPNRGEQLDRDGVSPNEMVPLQIDRAMW